MFVRKSFAEIGLCEKMCKGSKNLIVKNQPFDERFLTRLHKGNPMSRRLLLTYQVRNRQACLGCGHTVKLKTANSPCILGRQNF